MVRHWEVAAVQFAKRALLMLVMVAGIFGAVLLYQYGQDGLTQARHDGKAITPTDVETGMLFTAKDGQQFHVFARRRVFGDEKLTTSWLTIEKEHAPYRVSNIRLSVEGGSFQTLILDQGHDDGAVGDTMDHLSYAYKSDIRKSGDQIMFQCAPVAMNGSAAKIRWTFDIVRDNLIGWTVCENETVEFEMVW